MDVLNVLVFRRFYSLRDRADNGIYPIYDTRENYDCLHTFKVANVSTGFEVIYEKL